MGVHPHTMLELEGNQLMGRLGRSAGHATQRSAAVMHRYDPVVDSTLSDTFKPQFIEREKQPKHFLGKPDFLEFDVSSLFRYYVDLRFLGYAFQGIFPIMLDKARSFVGNVAPGAEAQDQDRMANAVALSVEAAAFTGLATAATISERNHILENCRLALSAELGKPIEEIGDMDLLHTSNPIIGSQVNRWMAKIASRFGVGAGFATSYGVGMVANALSITLERSIFFQKTAYDQLVELVNDVQSNHYSGAVAIEHTVNGLQRVLQSVQVDRAREHISEFEMTAIRPTLTKVAEDIVSKHIGIDSVIAVLGGGIIIPGAPEQSATNYEYVRQYRVEGVAQLAKNIRSERGVNGDAPIWEHGVAHVSSAKHYLDESTSPAKLMSERYKINENNTAHYGVRL